MPKVSVLMPVYRTQEVYLREAIESILNQSFSDFEFLILDDCPEDSRESIVRSFHDKRIRYIKNTENLGISRSRNKLIDMALGEYLAIFDHDDISLPTRLEKEVSYLEEHADVGVVSCRIKYMSNNKVSRYPHDSHNIKMALMKSSALPHSASMIRKSVLVENNIRYEETYSPAEDYALWCRLSSLTEFHNLDDVLFLYRDHLDNTSHRQKEKMQVASTAIWSFYKSQNPELYQEFLMRSTMKIRVNLLHILPFLNIRKDVNYMKIKVFGIPILNIKFSRKVQEGD